MKFDDKLKLDNMVISSDVDNDWNWSHTNIWNIKNTMTKPVDILDLYILLSVVDINICLSSDISDADLRNFLGDGLVGERFDNNMFKYCSCDIAVLLLYSLLQRNESVVIC